jgi:uncharacterized membrane protein YidH (DUF202 family)
MDWLVQLEQGALGIGVFIVVFSFVLYIKRTGDVKAVIFFWQKRLQLTRQEFIINLTGLGLMIAGVIVRLIYRTFFIGG